LTWPFGHGFLKASVAFIDGVHSFCTNRLPLKLLGESRFGGGTLLS